MAAAYDPIFYLHHSMIDKLFASWQLNPSAEQNTSITRFLTNNSQYPPFDNPEHNDYFNTEVKTNIGQLDALEYKKNFGYEYDVLRRPRMNSDAIKQECKVENFKKGVKGNSSWKMNCKKSGSVQPRNNAVTSAIEVRLYAAFVLQKHISGQLEFKFCKSQTKCRFHYISLFGDLKHLQANTGDMDTSKFHILPQLILDCTFNSLKSIPKELPDKLRWNRVEEIGNTSRLEPFTIMDINLHKQKQSKRYVFLPKGSADKTKYEALLDAHFRGLKYEIRRRGDYIHVSDTVHGTINGRSKSKPITWKTS